MNSRTSAKAPMKNERFELPCGTHFGPYGIVWVKNRRCADFTKKMKYKEFVILNYLFAKLAVSRTIKTPNGTPRDTAASTMSQTPTRGTIGWPPAPGGGLFAKRKTLRCVNLIAVHRWYCQMLLHFMNRKCSICQEGSGSRKSLHRRKYLGGFMISGTFRVEARGFRIVPWPLPGIDMKGWRGGAGGLTPPPTQLLEKKEDILDKKEFLHDNGTRRGQMKNVLCLTKKPKKTKSWNSLCFADYQPFSDIIGDKNWNSVSCFFFKKRNFFNFLNKKTNF